MHNRSFEWEGQDRAQSCMVKTSVVAVNPEVLVPPIAMQVPLDSITIWKT